MLKYILCLILFVGIQFLPKKNWEPERSQFRFNPNYLKIYDFNLKAAQANLMWLRFIAADLEYTKYRDDKSWHYYLVDASFNLNPSIQRRYRKSGQLLSVYIDDKWGAKDIFDRGVARFPEYWELAYSAGYHYMEEIKDYSKAADLLQQAVENGAKDWVMSLVGKLYSQAGRLEFAIITLENFLANNPQIKERAHIEKRLKNLKEQALTIAK